ncbi:tyrosine-type recombinase/integrase [Bilophila wadsworthia]
MAVQKSVSLHTVAELMGHRSIAMTQRYAHLPPESLRNTVNLLQGA